MNSERWNALRPGDNVIVNHQRTRVDTVTMVEGRVTSIEIEFDRHTMTGRTLYQDDVE